VVKMENDIKVEGCFLKNTLMEIIITTHISYWPQAHIICLLCKQKTTPELVLQHVDPLLVTDREINSHTTAAAMKWLCKQRPLLGNGCNRHMQRCKRCWGRCSLCGPC
jgi:hypothetical protein